MIDSGMVLALILANLQAEGRDVAFLRKEEIDKLVEEAIDDLQFAESVVRGMRQ